MNMNQNPKVLHFALEAVQILGVVGAISGLPIIPAPYGNVISAAATAIATIIKTQVIGNIPPAQTGGEA